MTRTDRRTLLIYGIGTARSPPRSEESFGQQGWLLAARWASGTLSGSFVSVDGAPPMAAFDHLFAGSIPGIYDRFLVPLIFESYALDLAERLARTEPKHILEIAAGTGVLTRAIASHLPAHARIVATDLNEPMLSHASAQLSHDSRIVWLQADALSLPFDDQGFDVVACQFGVMFFSDKVREYSEARRM